MEGAEKLKSIKQIGSVAQARPTLFPRCLHSWILLHYVSDWSICHGEKGNCNGTKRGKTWVIDAYYWELKRGNSSITQANKQEATEIVHSFLLPFQRFLGSRDALSILSRTQSSPCYPLSYICSKAIILQDLWTLHRGSDLHSTDAVVSAQLYHCRDRTMIHKPWTLCIPNAWVQKRRLQEQQRLLPSTLEGSKTCSPNDPYHNH